MDCISPNNNIIAVQNIWNNIFNAPTEGTIFCRVKSITLTRHPKINYKCQLTWMVDFWKNRDDIGVVDPDPLILTDLREVPRVRFSMDIDVTPKDQDGLGVFFSMVKTQLECNLGAMGGHFSPSSFTYRDMCRSKLEDGTSYLVKSSSGKKNKHIIDFEYRKVFGLDASGDLVQQFEGMVVHSEGEGCIEIPIPYNYKGMSLLYSALEVLYDNTPITISVIKNNQVISNAYKS